MSTMVQNLEESTKAFRFGKSNTKSMPPIFVIEPTNMCNLSCIMCPNRLYKEKGMMPLGFFTGVVDQIAKYAKTIMLCFVGEPLLHPDLVEMIRYCKNRTTAKIILSTNAMLLDKTLSKGLIDSKLDEIILSVEGTSRQTHESIRRGADFERVARNVEDFVVAAGENGALHCIL